MNLLKLTDFIPDFTRFETALSFKEADRVPNFEMYVAKSVAEPILGYPLPDGVRGEVIYRPRFGYDYIYVVPPYKHPPIYSHGAALVTEVEGNQRNWVDQHSSLITDWDSLRNYHEYPEPTEPLDIGTVKEAIAAVKTMKGRVGVGALLPAAPFSEVNLLMGYENFAIALYENYDLCKALVDKLGAVGVASAEQLAKENIDFVLFGDDMAYGGGMIIDPAMMRDLFFPWYRKFIAIVRDAGKLVIFHSDGNIEPVIPDFVEAGLNALNPIEPAAMNIVGLKNKYYGKLALTGNIDVDILSRGTPLEVENLVKERINVLKPGGGYMLGSSNSVCDYVKPKNYVTMMNTSWVYGKY